MEKQIPEASKKIDKNRDVRRILIILFLVASAFFAFWLINMNCCSSPKAAKAAKAATIKSYLDMASVSAADYYSSSSSYIGFDKSEDYVKICEKIAGTGNDKSPCSAQINERSYCIKAKLSLSQSDGADYWCVDSGHSGGSITGELVADEYCTPEKPYCAESSLGMPSLPEGYTFNNYSIEKQLDVVCQKHTDCAIPAEYSIQSRCPFVSLCLKGKCTVVCPAQEN